MDALVREQMAAAVTDHARWILTLSECLGELAEGSAHQCSEFVKSIGAADACSLGRWLRELPRGTEGDQFRSVRDLHRRFHEVASEVIALGLEGATNKAIALLEEGLFPLSRQLVAELEALARADEVH